MDLSLELRKNINKQLDATNDPNEVIKILKKYAEYELKGSQLGRAFEKMYINDKGFSPNITISKLQEYHHSFYTTNGGDWCRSDQGYLGKKYNLYRKHEKGRICSVKADGFNKNTKIKQSIRSDISKKIQSQRCVILDVGTNIECDHKDGMKNNWRLNDPINQKSEDFQPLSKAANDAKRQHCKICQKTGKRYDAKKLGYSVSYTLGTAKSKTCVGCYWYDPKEFNKTISNSFKKEDE